MNVVEKSTSQPILSEKPLGLLSVGRNLFSLLKSPIKYNTAGQLQINLRIQRWEKQRLKSLNMLDEEDDMNETNPTKGE